MPKSISRGTLLCCAAMGLFPVWTKGQDLSVYAPLEPQAVFAGEGRKVEAQWTNLGPDAQVDVSYKIFEYTNRTPLVEGEWKKLRILSGQRVIETAVLDFPGVEKPTSLSVNWFIGRHCVGTSIVHVYPTNLLAGLRATAGKEPVGLVDLEDFIGPGFKAMGLRTTNLMGTDLTGSRMSGFQGKLVVVTGNPAEPVASRIPELAERGVGIVWVQSRFRYWAEPMRPSFYVVRRGKGAVVVVQRDFLADFATNPFSQVRFLQCCGLALKPEMPDLPKLRQ